MIDHLKGSLGESFWSVNPSKGIRASAIGRGTIEFLHFGQARNLLAQPCLLVNILCIHCRELLDRVPQTRKLSQGCVLTFDDATQELIFLAQMLVGFSPAVDHMLVMLPLSGTAGIARGLA